jgi:hypothetical protein
MQQGPSSHPELAAAHQCALEGQFDQAYHHLEVAAIEGAEPGEIQRERLWIEAMKGGVVKARLDRILIAVALPVFAYLVMSVAQPSAYGQTLWAALALAVVPLLTGVAMAKLVGGGGRGTMFVRSFLVAGSAMGLYTAINLIIVRSRIAEPADSMALFLVGSTVTVLYALCAGLVAGIVSAALTKEESV